AAIRKPSVGGFYSFSLGYRLWQVKDIVGYLQVFEAVLYGIAVVVVAVAGRNNGRTVVGSAY
ncbi:MAG: hypothetical protein II202_03025, partial [Bacteroidales bacterium]|nr:hypothetical protein [Bacteroidales bacterium]